MQDAAERDLVLVGAGHAHVQVLRRWMMRPVPGVRLSAVLDRPLAVYSGMVPGFVAGDYRADELEIDAVPLARRAGARVLLAPATRIDPVARRIELEGRPSISYDIASLDVGSSVRDLDLPGVREHAVATRPIRGLVDRIDARLDRLAEIGDGKPPRIVVVGGGAAGVELAFTLQARTRAGGRPADIAVFAASQELLPGAAPQMARRVRREAERRGIRIQCGVRVLGVEKDAVVLAAGREPCDLAVWATGASPPPLLATSPLPLDDAGFVRVRSSLQVVGHDSLFAVGDCAALEGSPWVTKAGVYAVRAGPALDANLRALCRGSRPRAFRPQRDFLTLLNLGGGRALGAKWGLVFAGRWVWRWKDWIDRRFIARFRALDRDGAPAREFPDPGEMAAGGDDMDCGGCAAKLGAPLLERALARLEPAPGDDSVLLGLDRPDDAAAVELPRGDVVLATLDAFPAFGDDPWLVGRVAAVNALSDVFAKGGRPRHALALVTVPEERPDRAEECLYQVLAGVRATLDPLGVSLVGGHTTRGDALFVGLSITGELDSAAELLPLGGARPGERLILSKALGTGVILAADMRGLATGAWLKGALASMLRPNAEAGRVARECGAGACTDVTGFGLAGHLAALLRASGCAAELDASALPALDGALPLLAAGLRSTFHAQNEGDLGQLAISAELADGPAVALLFDPQTSGGLLFSVESSRADEAVLALRDAGDADAALIGEVIEARPDGALVAVRGAG